MQTNVPPLPTLPMHLLLSMGCWLSSPFAWQCANAAWPQSKNNASPGLQKAIAEEAKNRVNDLFAGLLRYQDSDYKRNVEEPASIWRHGSARLLDYGASAPVDAPMALFVPSLINRYYILDLEEERSLLRYIASQGIYPLVLDWGEPGDAEKKFGCEDYVAVLHSAIDFMHGMSKQKVALVGYCMGGVLALAAAQLNTKKISGLALLATPWDFHCREFAPFVVDKKWLPMVESMIGAKEHLPARMIQSLFYMTDPWVFEQKFRRFAGLKADSRAAKDFIALEHWVNDGVPMTARVARDCLIGWVQENQLMKGGWQVAGKNIDPKKIKILTFIAMPKSDHVVPYDCAAPLAAMMPHAETIYPGAGHVGMIVGSNARRELWQPLAEWIKDIN